MNDAHDRLLVYLHDLAIRHRRCHAPGLAGHATFTKEIVGPHYCDDSFLSLFGQDTDLYLALIDVEDRSCDIALREYFLVGAITCNRAPKIGFRQKNLWIERLI